MNWRLLRLLPSIVAPIIVIAFTIGHARGRHHSPAAALVVLVIAAMVAFYTLLAGPQFVREDLRSDLGNMDLLKTYPLAGWQVVGGQMLAPIAILSTVLWVALIAAAWALGTVGGEAEWHTLATRLVLFLCAASVAPPLCALQLIVPNAAMLLFPAWHEVTRNRTGGIEMMGQRLIFVFGQLFVMVLLLAPAGGIAGPADRRLTSGSSACRRWRSSPPRPPWRSSAARSGAGSGSSASCSRSSTSRRKSGTSEALARNLLYSALSKSAAPCLGLAPISPRPSS